MCVTKCELSMYMKYVFNSRTPALLIVAKCLQFRYTWEEKFHIYFRFAELRPPSSLPLRPLP